MYTCTSSLFNPPSLPPSSPPLLLPYFLSSYQWGYFLNTVVYAFRKPDKVEHCVIFWNTTTGEKYAKTVRNLLHITSCRDFCLLVTKLDDGTGQVREYNRNIFMGSLLFKSTPIKAMSYSIVDRSGNLIID